MMTEMKETLERASKALCRHLEVLVEEVEKVDGHVKDHMTIDGIKDCVKALKDIKKIESMDGNADAAKQPAASVAVVK
ncbi:MAG: hypothetical protein IKN03_06995 [Fibrobacter sp.]|nr:hypothetical protein [Fibrobacter sp.]MBR6855126.1 hypothetical protein [Fibrobacter sp.]